VEVCLRTRSTASPGTELDRLRLAVVLGWSNVAFLGELIALENRLSRGYGDGHAPDGRPPCAASSPIIISPEVGGLHHRCDRQAAYADDVMPVAMGKHSGWHTSRGEPQTVGEHERHNGACINAERGAAGSALARALFDHCEITP
jgi:hypothetical protein